MTADLREGAPLILFAPGAGAGSDSTWMRAWSERLGALAVVEAMDYPYRLAGKKAPDKLPVLVAAHRAALAAARARHPVPSAAAAVPSAAARMTVLVGKSMGGRIGCHVALEEQVDAIVCLGYPLRGTSGALRDEVLLSLRTPILFVQGTRDPLCPLDALATVRARMTAPNELLIIEGGNHSLEVPRGRSARLPATESPQATAEAKVVTAVMKAIASFLRR